MQLVAFVVTHGLRPHLDAAPQGEPVVGRLPSSGIEALEGTVKRVSADEVQRAGVAEHDGAVFVRRCLSHA